VSTIEPSGQLTAHETMCLHPFFVVRRREEMRSLLNKPAGGVSAARAARSFQLKSFFRSHWAGGCSALLKHEFH